MKNTTDDNPPTRVETSLPEGGSRSGRKWAVIGILLVIGAVIAFFILLFPFGLWTANPRN